MQPFDLISRNFWLVCFAITWINFFVNSRAGVKDDLSLEDQATRRRYLFNFALITCLPWLVMGAGTLSGSTPAVWFYFRPQDGNPYVIGWLASIVLMQLWLSWWILFADGARKMTKYRLGRARVGRQSKPVPEILAKLMAIGAPFFAVLWIFVMVKMDAKIPHFYDGAAPVSQTAP